jgi:hypothetical protein
MNKFECCHADTCLSDYWSGHHLPHISVPAYPMTLDELKRLLHGEVFEGAIAGAIETHEMPESFFDALNVAIDEITATKDILFDDIEIDADDDFNTVYAYFVFVERD